MIGWKSELSRKAKTMNEGRNNGLMFDYFTNRLKAAQEQGHPDLRKKEGQRDSKLSRLYDTAECYFYQAGMNPPRTGFVAMRHRDFCCCL